MANKKTIYNDIVIEKGLITNLNTLSVPNIISEVPLMKGFEHTNNIVGKAKVFIGEYTDGQKVLMANLVLVKDHHLDGWPMITVRHCKGKVDYDELQCVILIAEPNKDTTIKSINQQLDVNQ